MKRLSLIAVAVVSVAALSACADTAGSSVAIVSPEPTLLSLPPVASAPVVPDALTVTPDAGGSSLDALSAPQPKLMSRGAASSVVLNAVGEGELVSIDRTVMEGVDSFAVTVLLPTGGIIVGYVDVVNGVTFHWEQTPAPVATYADDSHDDEGHEGDNDDD